MAAEGETNSQGIPRVKDRYPQQGETRTFHVDPGAIQKYGCRLPTTVHLPYGDYLANNVPCSIQQDKESPKVAIYLQVQVASGSDAWLWVGLGAAAVVALGTGIGVYMLSQDDQADALRIYSLETQ